MEKLSLREQIQQMREDSILSAMNRLLAEKGFELMTLDELASQVGVSKASLYKRYGSKEALAAAAMVRVLDQALAQVQVLAPVVSPRERLRGMARWAMSVQLAGDMPSLPSQNSSLRQALMADGPYMDRLVRLSDELGAWIAQAQAEGELGSDLPPELVLYTLFARACDPVLGLLKAGGQHSDDQIITLLLRTCFDGLGTTRS